MTQNNSTQVDLRSMGHIGTTGDRCGSGVEWVPYDLDDSAGADQSFTSWRTREGRDPVVAGPHWDEVRQQYGRGGRCVSMQWFEVRAKRQSLPPFDHPLPLSPVVCFLPPILPARGQLSFFLSPSISSPYLPPPPPLTLRLAVFLARRAPAFTQKKVKQKLRAAGVTVTWDTPRSQSLKSAPRGGHDSKRSGGGLHGPAGGPAANVRAPEVAELAAMAAAQAAAAGEAGPRGENGGVPGRPWKTFVVVVSCVGVAAVACSGRTKRKNRRVGAKRRKQVMEWSANAFSTNTLSPLASAAPKPAFAWTGTVRNKHHQV